MKVFRNLAIIILMTAFLIILSTKAEATTGTINSETVNLRKEANTKSTILEQLDKNDKVEILEQEEGWYKVSITISGEKITGYISEKLIDVEGNVSDSNEQKPEENQTTETPSNEEEPNIPQEDNEQTPTDETVTDISNRVEENKEYELQQAINIKVLPLINSMNKETISSGNIKVVEIINDWCKIENDTQEGWIRANVLKKATISSDNDNRSEEVSNEDTDTNTQDTTEGSNKPETKPASSTVIKTAYVSAESLKVRKEASTSSEIIDSLKKNAQVSILEELDGWYKIKLSGKIGYVSSKYISDKKVEETTSRGTNTSRTETTTESNSESTNTTETTNTTTSNTVSGTAVVEYAKQYLGYKYVSGGASPSTGFDCSGFTTYVYKHFGVTLHRTSKDQIKNGVAVEKSNLQPGDIVVFNGESNTSIGHVGIYIGDGNFIHASNPKGGVKITELSSSYYATRYVGARRVI